MFRELSVDISCRPETLWPYLVTEEKMKEWMTGLISFKPVAGPPEGLGSVWEMEVKEGPKVSRYRAEYIAYEPNRKITFRMTGGALKGDQFMTATYLVEDRPGGVKLRGQTDIDENQFGFVARMMMPLMAKAQEKQMAKFFESIKQLAEADEARNQ